MGFCILFLVMVLKSQVMKDPYLKNVVERMAFTDGFFGGLGGKAFIDFFIALLGCQISFSF